MGSRRLRLSRLLVSLFLFLFFFSHRNSVLAKLILKPSDTESLVGSLAFLNCSTDNAAEEIFWFHYAVGSADRKIIYGYKKLYEARFQMEKTEAAAGAGTVAFNLVIPVVTDKDAGKYECQDGAGQGERSPQVQMVVLVGPAVCETDIRRPEGVIGPNSCGLTPEDIQLTCKVKFLGNEPPIVAWFREDSNQPITDGVSHSHSNDYVIHNVTITADSSIDGRSFECRPTRSPSPPPTAQRLCATETVTVVGDNAVASNTLFIVVIICLVIALPPVAFIMGCVVDRRLAINRRKRKSARAEEAIPLIDTSDIAKRLEEENKRLKDELDRYENMIYRKDEVKYKEKPKFAHEIKTKQRSSLISGITLWHHRLYVVHENCSSIEVYDSKTFTLERSLPVKNLANPLDIASSESSEYLYVADKPGIQLETSQPVKEDTQTAIHQSKVNEKDAVEIKSNEESLPHDDKGDKSKKNVQKNKEDEFKRKENSPKILEKGPTKNNKDQSSDRRTTDEAPIDTADHLPGEHQTGEQLTGSNKDNETPECYQQKEQSTDDEKEKLLETTESKDNRNESELKEEDKKHSQKNGKKDPSSIDDENNQGEDQATAKVQKDQTVDGRTEEPQRDTDINQLKACKAECPILALDARGSVKNNYPWKVDDVECRLSVAYSSSNVIVCLQNKRQIIEFSSSGEELRRIRLSPGDGFHKMFHAIRVSHSYFAVSHCKDPRSDDHRLSIIDEKGKIRFTSNDLNSFKLVSKNDRMNMASRLIVDCNKSILMSDAMNCRVLLFDATLKEDKELIPKDGIISMGLKNQPTRITLDEENGRLFIALKQKDEKMSQNEGVSVFQVA